jgi:3-methyl-2-oxobutanoate hydroxymethyltransferase
MTTKASSTMSTSQEETAPYGSGASATPTAPSGTASDTATGTGTQAVKRVRTHHLAEWKSKGERFTMLTAYDMYTAQVFDEAGIDLLLVGDSAANNVYGYETSLPVTVDELIPLTRAVARSARRAMVVGDLPFGSYQASPEQAYLTAVRFMKEGLAHCVKLEGGAEMAPVIAKLTTGGIPVIAHIGFTPQSEHALGGYRVQGRGEAAERVMRDAKAVAEAGAFAVVMEMVPGDIAGQITRDLPIPTIGIGAGNQTDGQVLVWQDAFGMRTGRMPRFVKQYADLRGALLEGARAYAEDVKSGSFPAPEHTF